MSTDLESRVHDLLHRVDVDVAPVDPNVVVARGHRVRGTRRARWAVATTTAVALVAAGLATVTVPATGHPLSPIVWAAGNSPSGLGAPAWMSVGGRRYRASIEETRVDHRKAWVMVRVLPAGVERHVG